MSSSALPSLPLLCIASLLCLFILLIVAAYFDIRFRRIPNSLCVIAALVSVPYWGGMSGLAMPTSMGQQFLVLLVATVPLLGFFVLGALGGGDIKMLGAVLLWIRPGEILPMIALMVLAGGVIAVAAMGHALLRRRRPNEATVPFGVAIAVGAIPALTGELLVNLKALNLWG